MSSDGKETGADKVLDGRSLGELTILSTVSSQELKGSEKRNYKVLVFPGF